MDQLTFPVYWRFQISTILHSVYRLSCIVLRIFRSIIAAKILLPELMWHSTIKILQVVARAQWVPETKNQLSLFCLSQQFKKYICLHVFYSRTAWAGKGSPRQRPWDQMTLSMLEPWAKKKALSMTIRKRLKVFLPQLKSEQGGLLQKNHSNYLLKTCHRSWY